MFTETSHVAQRVEFAKVKDTEMQNEYEENNFYSSEQVAEILMVSKPTAYRIIKKLNDELSGRGYITINGKVSIKFFHEKFYN